MKASIALATQAVCLTLGTAGRFNYCDAPTRLSGAFAEFCIAPVTNSWLVPKSMDMESAAMLEPLP